MDATFGDRTTIVDHSLAGGGTVAFNRHDRLGFSLDEFGRRYRAVLDGMAERGLDVLLIRGPENLTWFCGYETPGYYKYHCIIVAPGQEPVFVLRRFEELNVPEYSWITRHVPVDDWEHPPSVTVRAMQQMGLSPKRVGCEKQGWFYTVDEHETLTKAFGSAAFEDATDLIEGIRLIKSGEEIAMMQRSAGILDKAIMAGMDVTAAGVNENHINAEINRVLFENGGEYMGLPPFILAGPRTCLPHQTARGETVRDRDVVYFEVSCSQYRYAVALMRTFFVGEPEDEWRRCGEAVLEALEAAIDIIKPGVTSEDADRAARSVIEKAGFGDYFRHRLGYSIGVNYPPDWGEGQIMSLRKGEPRELQPGMCFHMVPLCLKYREFGFGYSETIRVTETGCEPFSKLGRELLIK